MICFNPLHEWIVKDTLTGLHYDVYGIRQPPLGDGYYVSVSRTTSKTNKNITTHLEFCPDYYEHLEWIKKEK